MRRTPTLLTLLLALFPGFPGAEAPHRHPTYLPAQKLTLTAETDDDLSCLVMGLPEQSLKLYNLPVPDGDRRLFPRPGEELEREIYGLTFEMLQGGILRCLPARTQVYLAAPDPATVKGATGRETAYFKYYLLHHCGWTEAQFQERIHFFKSPNALLWSEDAGQVLGKDDEGRKVIATSPSDPAYYRDFVSSLTQTYPGQFRAWTLPENLSTEGGDEELTNLPDGKVGLVLGHHRILKYIQNKYQKSFDGAPLDPALEEEAQAAYSSGFLGVPLLILPQKALGDPSAADQELFHLDMLVSFLDQAGKAQAFVPTYRYDRDFQPLTRAAALVESLGPVPTDSESDKPLDPAWVKRMQGEFDLISRQLDDAGFQVRRMPFADHPVRSPGNTLKFHDPDSGRDVVMLAKYPFHLPVEEGVNPMTAFGYTTGNLLNDYEEYRKDRTEAHLRQVLTSVDEAWRGLMEVEASPNPLFEKRVKLFRDLGYEVVTVPMFPSGAGSIHCLTLH